MPCPVGESSAEVPDCAKYIPVFELLGLEFKEGESETERERERNENLVVQQEELKTLSSGELNCDCVRRSLWFRDVDPVIPCGWCQWRAQSKASPTRTWRSILKS